MKMVRIWKDRINLTYNKLIFLSANEKAHGHVIYVVSQMFKGEGAVRYLNDEVFKNHQI